MTFLAVLPSIWPPYTQSCVAGMCPQLRESLLLVDNTEHNRGIATSWNLGAREVLARRLDWLAVISAATRFGTRGGSDFLDILEGLEDSDTWAVEASAPVGWHLIAWRRRTFERVGLFDQNFLAYGEDQDFSRRVLIAAEEDAGSPVFWPKVDVDAWIAMRGHGTELAGVRPDMEATIGYFERKWGSWPHGEYRRPFDDPALPLSFWPVPPDPRSIQHAETEVRA